MRQVMDYITWQVPALATWLKEDSDERLKTLLRDPPSKALSNVNLVTAPTAVTPDPLPISQKERIRYKARTRKAVHGRRVSDASSSRRATVTTDTKTASLESVAPLEAVSKDSAPLDPVPMETDSIPAVLEDVSRSSNAETGEDHVRSSAVEAEENAAGVAVFRNVDVRQKLASSAMGREKSHCTAKTWVRDMVKEGKEARVKLNYTTLRASLAGKLEKEKCLPLPTHALWSYAKDVMDAILPSMRRAGLYRPLPDLSIVKKKNSSSARQSAAQPPTAAQTNRARRPEQQQNRAPAPEDQDGFRKQGRPRKHHTPSHKPYRHQQGPGPKKGSSSYRRN